MDKQPSLWNCPRREHGTDDRLDEDLAALRGGQAFPPGFDARAIAGRARRRRQSVRGAAAICVACLLVWVGLDARFTADYHAPVGTVAEVTLPDGTRAFLDSGTALSWSETAAERRAVLHSGVAVFESAPGDSRPLMVETDLVTAQPVGTVFGVAAEEGPWLTVVEEGRVQVTVPGGSEAVTLMPGEAATAVAGVEGLRVIQADTSRMLAWRDGYIEFEGAAVSEVIGTLNRYFPGQLVLMDRTKTDRHFDGAVSIRDFDAALASVVQATGLEIVLEAPFLIVLK